MRFDDLADRLRQGPERPLIVVGAAEPNLLASVSRAASEGLATPILVGDRALIESVAAEHGHDIGEATLVDEPDDEAAALRSMAILAEHPGAALMKGTLSTPTLMRVALRNGLRDGDRLLTHIAAFEHPRLDRLVLLSDSGLLPYPSLDQRLMILDNAIAAAQKVGIKAPNIAMLSANEEVNEAITCSVHYARICEFAGEGRFPEAGALYGPVDLYSAIDPAAAKKKRIAFEGAGHADILHCPDVVSGNLMGKSITFFGGATTGGCIVGGTAPVVLLSRVSSPQDKYASILVGLSCA